MHQVFRNPLKVFCNIRFNPLHTTKKLKKIIIFQKFLTSFRKTISNHEIRFDINEKKIFFLNQSQHQII